MNKWMDDQEKMEIEREKQGDSYISTTPRYTVDDEGIEISDIDEAAAELESLEDQDSL